MILTLAGPGAGKTTDMVKQIINNMELLDYNREMAIITYTNASVDDIKKKLIQEVVVPSNVFIGTIHSFLVRYFIKPYAEYVGYKANPIMIVDKFSNVGLEWVEEWVKKKYPDSNKNERKNKENGIILKQRNKTIQAAAKKGIYTYDSIIRISKELSEKRNVLQSIGNKLQYLYIDEYQDISKYVHNIILKIEKVKHTKIYVVGDPDQSIYRFRYGNSQIGEKAPDGAKQPLRELIAMDNAKCQKRSLLVNHRSSEEIVRFINQYSTLENQEPEIGKICKVQFLSTNSIERMAVKFDKLCEASRCETKLIVAKNNDTLQKFCDIVFKGMVEENKKIMDSKCIQDFIISSSGLNYNNFMDKYDFSPFELKKIVVGIRKVLMKYPQKDILEIASVLSKKLYGKRIVFSNSYYSDDKGKFKRYNFSFESAEQIFGNEKIKILTIHKAKGLEADGVLVIAENRKQFFKWLNMRSYDLKNEKDEDYRLGYVAYSRAKRVLALACLEKIDFVELNEDIFEEA
ncbi:MAG: ATP-dependent helicase [Lachnospiraceae bacterium]|nr:ATP-dependent helicase [Lachnospiraceae bacterium]